MVVDRMNRNKPGRPWLNAKSEYGPQTPLLPCVKNALFNGLNDFISPLIGRQKPAVQSSSSK